MLNDSAKERKEAPHSTKTKTLNSNRLQVTGFAHWIDVDAVFGETDVIPILGPARLF